MQLRQIFIMWICTERPAARVVAVTRLGLLGTSGLVPFRAVSVWRPSVIPTSLEMSGFVQVFGRRHDEAIHALRRPASEKRQCTKSREVGHWLAASAMGIVCWWRSRWWTRREQNAATTFAFWHERCKRVFLMFLACVISNGCAWQKQHIPQPLRD